METVCSDLESNQIHEENFSISAMVKFILFSIIFSACIYVIKMYNWMKPNATQHNTIQCNSYFATVKYALEMKQYVIVLWDLISKFNQCNYDRRVCNYNERHQYFFMIQSLVNLKKAINCRRVLSLLCITKLYRNCST